MKDNDVITTVRPITFSLANPFTFSFPSLNLFLSQLELGYNPIGPDGAKALAEVLKFHGNVKTLKLGWCQVNLNDLLMSAYMHLEIFTNRFLGCIP